MESTQKTITRAVRLYFSPLKKIVEFVSQIITFWRETWQQSKVLFLAEMGGTLTGMAAAGLMAWQSPEPNLFVVFTFYNISAILFIYSNFVRHSSWMIVLMTFYLIVTTIGWFKVLPI